MHIPVTPRSHPQPDLPIRRTHSLSNKSIIV